MPIGTKNVRGAFAGKDQISAQILKLCMAIKWRAPPDFSSLLQPWFKEYINEGRFQPSGGFSIGSMNDNLNFLALKQNESFQVLIFNSSILPLHPIQGTVTVENRPSLFSI